MSPYYLLKPKTQDVLHHYEEDFHAQAPICDLREIAAEKYRDLLQSLDCLRDKGWGAN